MTTAPWSGPRGLRGRSLPGTDALRPAAWGRAVGTAAGTGVRTARGYVTSCSRKAFAVLCAVLVLLAMVAALLLNTARGAGAFQLAEAESSQRQAAETRLALEAQVDEMNSPEQVSRRAEDLGMVPAGTMGYVDPASGSVVGEAEEAEAAPRKEDASKDSAKGKDPVRGKEAGKGSQDEGAARGKGPKDAAKPSSKTADRH